MEIVRLVPLFTFLFFCGQIACKQIQLKRKGVQVSNLKYTPKLILGSLLLILFFIVFFVELLFQSGQIRFTFLTDILHIAIISSYFLALLGAIILLVSIITLYLSMVAFNTSFRFGINSDNRGELVTRGIFGLSRNPFFVSLLLFFIGIALVFPTPFFIGIFLLSAISIHFVILKEEKFLISSYGEQYREYTQNVRRYF